MGESTETASESARSAHGHAALCPRHFGPPQRVDAPDITLVVSTIGRPIEMRRMVESITLELVDGLDVELVVVDQGPDDQTRRVLDEADLAVPCCYLQSGIGVSAGRNAGLRLARGTYVMFPDDDTWFGGELLGAGIDRLDTHPEWDGLCVRLATDDGGDSSLRWSTRPRSVNAWNYHRTSIGPAMIFRREVVEAVGAYDETIGTGSPGWYGACEDSDLVLRVVEAGSTVRYEPDLVLHHREVRYETGPDSEAKSVLYGCGTGHLWRVHRFSRAWVLFLLVRRTIGSFLQAARGHRDVARIQRSWVRGAICGLIDSRPADTIPPTSPENTPGPGPDRRPGGSEFARSFSWRAVMAVSGIVATFGLTAYLARTLDDADLAYFLVLLVALALVPSLSRLGLNQEAVRQLSHTRAIGDWPAAIRTARAAVRSCVVPTLVTAAATAALVALAGDGRFWLLWVLTAIVLGAESFRLTYSDMLMGLGLPVWSALLAHHVRAVAVIVVVGIYHLAFGSPDLTGLLLLMAGVGCALAIVGHVRLWSIAHEAGADTATSTALFRWAPLGAGLPFLVVEVVGLVIARADVWLASQAFAEGDAVLYGTASTFANPGRGPGRARQRRARPAGGRVRRSRPHRDARTLRPPSGDTPRRGAGPRVRRDSRRRRLDPGDGLR